MLTGQPATKHHRINGEIIPEASASLTTAIKDSDIYGGFQEMLNPNSKKVFPFENDGISVLRQSWQAIFFPPDNDSIICCSPWRGRRREKNFLRLLVRVARSRDLNGHFSKRRAQFWRHHLRNGMLYASDRSPLVSENVVFIRPAIVSLSLSFWHLRID